MKEDVMYDENNEMDDEAKYYEAIERRINSNLMVSTFLANLLYTSEEKQAMHKLAHEIGEIAKAFVPEPEGLAWFMNDFSERVNQMDERMEQPAKRVKKLAGMFQ